MFVYLGITDHFVDVFTEALVHSSGLKYLQCIQNGLSVSEDTRNYDQRPVFKPRFYDPCEY